MSSQLYHRFMGKSLKTCARCRAWIPYDNTTHSCGWDLNAEIDDGWQRIEALSTREEADDVQEP